MMGKLEKAIEWLKEPTGLGEFDIVEDVAEELKIIKGMSVEEVGLEWDGDDLGYTLKECLDEFAFAYKEKIINVLESFIEEE